MPVKKPLQKPVQKAKSSAVPEEETPQSLSKKPAPVQAKQDTGNKKPSRTLKKQAKKNPPLKSKLGAKKSQEERKKMELARELARLHHKQDDKPQLKDAEGRLYCQHETCDQPAVTKEYCRHHYLILWKYLQNRKAFLKGGRMAKNLQDIVKVLGAEGLDFVLKDLKNDKSFEGVVQEMRLTPGGKEENSSEKELEY